MAAIKRKYDSECRVFKSDRTWKYFFTECNNKAVYLLCKESVAVYKDFSITCHFSSKHGSATFLSMNKEKVN